MGWCDKLHPTAIKVLFIIAARILRKLFPQNLHLLHVLHTVFNIIRTVKENPLLLIFFIESLHCLIEHVVCPWNVLFQFQTTKGISCVVFSLSRQLDLVKHCSIASGNCLYRWQRFSSYPREEHVFCSASVAKWEMILLKWMSAVDNLFSTIFRGFCLNSEVDSSTLLKWSLVLMKGRNNVSNTVHEFVGVAYVF